MKDQLAKQTKMEKEKAKKAKDQKEIYDHKIMKKNEKYSQINQRQKINRDTLDSKMNQLNRKVQQKLDLAQQNKQKMYNEYL